MLNTQILQGMQRRASSTSQYAAPSIEGALKGPAGKQKLLPSEEIMNIARRSSGSGSFKALQAGNAIERLLDLAVQNTCLYIISGAQNPNTVIIP